MRLLPLLLILGFLAALAPGAYAQGMPSLTLEVLVPSMAVEAGNASALTLRMTRVCSNPVTVLEAQDVHIVMVPGVDPVSGEPVSGTWTFDGPQEAQFEQQICAMQGQQTITLEYQATSGADAVSGQHPFTVRVHAPAASPTTPEIPEVPQNFVLNVAEKPPAPVVVEETPERESPGLGGIGALVALAAAVLVALRRR